MRTVPYSEVRQNLAKMLDHVVDDAEEIVVTRSGHEAAVIISLREYESLKETAYLMASPANARRLNEAVEELRNGGGEMHDLIDPDARSGEASAA
jgi:antitoxin YefM